MEKYLIYGNKKCKKLVFNISPKTPFQDILGKLTRITYYGAHISSEHITYSVLELINNSLRAQREREAFDPILLRIHQRANGFYFYLRDWGGGFDISQLPYDINTRVEEIDIHNEVFERYRQEHEYMRFGLGLYLARKTFPVFSISFIDGQEQPVDWIPGTTAGTIIELQTVAQDLPAHKRYVYARQA